MTTVSKTVELPAPRSASYAFAPTTPKPSRVSRRGSAVSRRLADGVPAAAPGRLPGNPPGGQQIRALGGPAGETWMRLFRPLGVNGVLPVVIYVHGGDAPFSDVGLQADRLATQVRAAVVVVDYSLAPGARIPVALEENFVAAAWVAEHGDDYGLDGRRIAVGSDESGLDMGDELLLMADVRGGPALAGHVRWSAGATAALRAALAA
jgi:acetyl esterase/lipase